MQALLFPAFDFVAKSRVAQIILGLGVFYFLVKARDAMRDRHTRARVERRIEKKSRRVQARIERDLDEKSTQVERARESAPVGVDHSDGVPEHLRGVLFGD
jgi:hypothetical protein